MKKKKEMKKYFVRISAVYTAKNKAQKQAYAVCETYDHSLMATEEALKLFRKHLDLDLRNVSDEHPKCKPVAAEVIYTEEKMERLSVAGGVVIMDIYQVAEEYTL